MEHFLLQDLVVVRDEDAQQVDDEQPPDLVLGGVTVKAMAQFRVSDQRCRSGVADAAAAYLTGVEAGAPTDLRGHAPAAVQLGGAWFDLWQLPEWPVGTWTVLHLVLVAKGCEPVPREAHRQVLGALHVEHGDGPVRPVSMGTFGGNGLMQCTAQFRGPIKGLRATIDQTTRKT